MKTNLSDGWCKVYEVSSEMFSYESDSIDTSELLVSYDWQLESFVFHYIDNEAVIILPREQLLFLAFQK